MSFDWTTFLDKGTLIDIALSKYYAHKGHRSISNRNIRFSQRVFDPHIPEHLR